MFDVANAYRDGLKSFEKDRTVYEPMLTAYEARTAWRKSTRTPVLCFLGHGRHGKDASAIYWCNKLNIAYPGSASVLMTPLIAATNSCGHETAWTTRHENRAYWRAFCDGFRAKDPSLLARMCLGLGDVLVGLRGAVEVMAVKKECLTHAMVWIRRPGFPDDPTVEFTAGDCDFTIENGGSLLDLYAKIDRLAEILEQERFEGECPKPAVSYWRPE